MSNQSTVTTIGAKPAAKADVPAAKISGSSGSGELSGVRKIITIAAGKGDGERDRVFVGVQGTAFLIPRGKPTNVPVEVVNVLQDAQEMVSEYDDDTKQVIYTPAPRYTFSVSDAPATA